MTRVEGKVLARVVHVSGPVGVDELLVVFLPPDEQKLMSRKLTQLSGFVSGFSPFPWVSDSPGAALRVDPPRDEVGCVGHALDVDVGVVVLILHARNTNRISRLR